MLRAVVDPGVLIAALLSPRGAPARILLAWLEGRFHLVVSPGLLSELERVLRRPKFRPYLTEEEAAAYVSLIRHFALAREHGADFLVSGDPHLTRLRRARPPVVSPRDFLAGIEKTP